jgi:hypothetical protein
LKIRAWRPNHGIRARLSVAKEFASTGVGDWNQISAGERIVSQFQLNLRLALKVQGQCRATVETLAVIKNPPVFAKQANITSGPQQVNNGSVVNGSRPATREEDLETAPNELLEAYRERLDGSQKTAAEGGDTSLESVGTVERPPNSRRQGAFISQRVSRRRSASAP